MENKKYQLIYADPAWSYDRKAGQGVADDIYKTMSLEEIKALPIKEMSEDKSVLLMWATFPMLQEALEVIKAWGFEYKTCGFNWIKLNENGTPFFGIGHYTKSNSEICLLAIRGGGASSKRQYNQSDSYDKTSGTFKEASRYLFSYRTTLRQYITNRAICTSQETRLGFLGQSSTKRRTEVA